MKRGQRAAAALIAMAACVAWAASSGLAPEGQRWWKHVEYLASDQLEGRGTGTPGYEKAAEYVASQFHDAGLQPAGTQGYFQPVQFRVARLDERRSSVALIAGGARIPLAIGPDAILGKRGETGSFEAEAVFAGYGLTIPEANYDDLRGLDLKRKAVVYLSGAPEAISGPLKSHYQSFEQRWKFLRAAGAIGFAAILNPKGMDVPWSRVASARSNAAMSLAGVERSDEGLQFSLTINPAAADQFLAGTGHTVAELLADADSGRPLPHFPLRRRIAVTQTFVHSEAESPNVAGVLEGDEPNLRNEYVILSAHLDHLGIGAPVHGDRIYNGALDNAAGIASLIEIARHLRDSGVRLHRSVLFLAAAAEEKGELGSQYFAAHPTVPAGGIVADINMDMFMPLFPLRYLEVQGLGESTLGASVREAAKDEGIKIQADKQPRRNRFIRSDQYSFVKHGIPALAFKFGYVPGTPEEKIFQGWLRTRYHAPSDDVSQPVDLAAAAQFDRVIERLLIGVANDQKKPEWLPNSFFRRFAR